MFHNVDTNIEKLFSIIVINISENLKYVKTKFLKIS